MPANGPRWGFHELHADVARRLVAAAEVRPGELVVDVGAGTGAITAALLARGARVVAVELHPGRARLLRSRFDPADVRVVTADVLRWRPPREPFRVVANPPFDIAVALLRHLTRGGTLLREAHLVLPSQLAARAAAGRLAAIDGYDARIAARLPVTAFRPPATQRTAVVVLSRRRRSRR